MKAKHTNRLIAFLLALVMMFGMMPMTAFAAGGSESDPVIVSTFADLKTAMEDSVITYVQLNATTAMIPVAEGSSWGISAISIKGTKVLILNGNSTFTSRISGPVHNFFRLSGSNLTIQGKGKLSYEAARVNGTNALAYLEAGSTLTVDDPDITLYGGYNSAVVHGRAIYVTNGTVNISAGVFQGVSAYSEATIGLSAVYLGGGATANISGGTFGYTTVEYTPTTPYPALCIDDTLGVVSLSGGTYENGIKVTKGKTINDYLATGCSYNTSDTGTVTVTNPYLLNNLSATVTNPVAGATPATAATSGDSSKYSVTVQGWYKGGTVSSPGTEVGSSEKFEAGEAYTVKLLFTPKPLYEIKAGAYVNINKTTAYHFGSTPTTHVYTKTFEVPANLSATVTVPVAGATPATAATSGDSSKYSVTVQGWYKGGTVSSPGTVMGSNDKFTAGETYIVRLMFNAKSPYEITFDSTATINGQTAHFDAYNAAGNYYYCLAFTVSAAAPVSSFEIADLTAPVHGVAADYSASVTNTGFTVKSIRYGIRTTGLTSGDPYTGKVGDNLEIGVIVEASDGYTFSTTPTPYWNGIEGKSYKMVSMPDNQRYFVFKYTVPATETTEVTSVSATVTAPVAGAHPNYTAVSGDSDKYTTTVEYWVDSTSSLVVIKAGDTFVGGRQYRAFVNFTPKDGYTFSSSLTASINSQSAAPGSSGDPDEHLFGVEFTVPAAHTHNYTGAWKSDATNHWQLCSCGEKGNTSAHAYGAWKVTKAATETATGSRERACAVCGYKQTEVIQKLSHTHTYTGAWKSDATNHWQLCSCGEKGNVAAHSFGSWTVTKSATEAATGSRERVCAVCSYKQTEVIAKLGHTHSYTGALASDSANHWQLCSCGEKGNVAAHSYGSWTIIKSATQTAEGLRERVCATCGYTQTEVIQKLSHTHSYAGDWKFDDTNHWQLCSCGEKGNTAVHAYGTWKVTKAATQTDEGLRERACAVCGYKQTEVIQKLSHTHSYTGDWEFDDTNHWQLCSCGEKGNTSTHSYGAWKVTKAPTQTDDGLCERVCAACGYKQTEVIAKLSHTHSYASEWKNDDSQHWHECDCGDKSDTSAHTFGDWTVTKEATETEEGLRSRTCSVCGYVESSVIPVIGHEHSYSDVWKTDSEKHWNECDCGEKSNEAAHTFGGWETVNEATETAEGSKKHICSVCGYEEYEAIPIIGTVIETDPPTIEPLEPEKPSSTTAIIVVSSVAGVVIVGAAIFFIIKRKKI